MLFIVLFYYSKSKFPCFDVIWTEENQNDVELSARDFYVNKFKSHYEK